MNGSRGGNSACASRIDVDSVDSFIGVCSFERPSQKDGLATVGEYAHGREKRQPGRCGERPKAVAVRPEMVQLPASVGIHPGYQQAAVWQRVYLARIVQNQARLCPDSRDTENRIDKEIAKVNSVPSADHEMSPSQLLRSRSRSIQSPEYGLMTAN